MLTFYVLRFFMDCHTIQENESGDTFFSIAALL